MRRSPTSGSIASTTPTPAKKSSATTTSGSATSSPTLEQRPYTSREFLNRLGGHLWNTTKQNGILTAAYRAGVPIFCPAIADSSIGMGLSQGRHKRPGSGHIDVIGDIVESANLVSRRPRTATVVLGGGTPKNFMNQASVQAEFFNPKVGGHKYALQIVTDVPHFGGASGSTLEEAQSWGKLAADAAQVTVHADATVALADSRHRPRTQFIGAREGPQAPHHGSERPRDAGRRRAHLERKVRRDGMKYPIEYDHIEPQAFGGTLPEPATFNDAKVVILPIPLESTISYVSGTRNGPREILVASSHMELWDEETNTDIHPIGIYTLPEMELPFDDMADLMAEIQRVVAAVIEHDKFPVFLGGEHSITAPIVAAVAEKHPGLTVLQIDAHADLRDTYMGTPFNHACAMRRVLEHARVYAGGHPEHVDRGGQGGTDAADPDLLRRQHAERPELDRRGRRITGRDRVHHDRLRRHGPGDHACDGHARTGRIELA